MKLKGILFFQMIDLSAFARTDLQEEIEEVQQDTSKLRDTLGKTDSRTRSEVSLIKEDIQQVNGSLWSNHRSTKGKKSS